MDKRIHSTSGQVLYSLGTVPSALPYNMIQSYLVTFYSIFIGLSMNYVGLLLILYGIWNAINDPLFGYMMDRKASRKYGRRIPYMVIGIVPLTIGFIFLWYVPVTEQIGIFFYALFILFLFDTGFTLSMTAYSALYTEMYDSEEERAKVAAIKDGIAFLSSMIGIILPPLIAASIGWEMVGLIFGLINPLMIIISLLGIEEKKEYQIDPPLPFFTAFKETLTNKAFLNITLTYSVLDYIFSLTMMVLPLYALFILQTGESMMGFAAGGVAVGIIGSIAVWRWIYAHKGPKEGLMIAILIFTIGMGLFFFVTSFWALIFMSIIPGFGAGGMLMTEPAISAAIDSDELITNKRREATFNGILAFISRISIVFSGITFIIIQYTTGFDAKATIQSESALVGLRLLISVIPLIGGLIALGIFSRFPLGYANFQAQQAKLMELHNKRKEKLHLMDKT
jgi:GPH family glycoside/pentoside/hexuronide:cation symporter